MNSQDFDRMISRSQKKREAKYQPLWPKIEEITKDQSVLRTYWRSADRHEKATLTASLLANGPGGGVLPPVDFCVRFLLRRVDLLKLKPEVIYEHC